ncbi:arsenate reductase [Oceanococcus atlanticus]|uniref:Arsenate reductase n=1 Tax=Oceanococcus atlanticus TaxID=1317117 RepID=A0A1Y1SAU1_9GAMM|nr:arsenate reductase (glutaredoxin) [Oceanococcus atlanticus]ORE85527.1 arsenate reductase [Oceanococcus atlanticus]
MHNFIWHNPRCSKSRQTLQLIQDAGIDIDIVEYLSIAPTVEQLGAACQGLGLKPSAIIRSKEEQFKTLGLSLKDERSDEQWLSILADNPKLIERPIVCINGRYALGRPPENVQELF